MTQTKNFSSNWYRGVAGKKDQDELKQLVLRSTSILEELQRVFDFIEDDIEINLYSESSLDKVNFKESHIFYAGQKALIRKLKTLTDHIRN